MINELELTPKYWAPVFRMAVKPKIQHRISDKAIRRKGE